MSESYEQIKNRYANSIWLRSETTYVEGPLRDSFDRYFDDSHTLIPPEQDRWRVTITTKAGGHHSVITLGQVDVVLHSTGKQLLIFSAIFGHTPASFAVVTDRVIDYKGAALDGPRKNPPRSTKMSMEDQRRESYMRDLL